MGATIYNRMCPSLEAATCNHIFLNLGAVIIFLSLEAVSYM